MFEMHTFDVTAQCYSATVSFLVAGLEKEQSNETRGEETWDEMRAREEREGTRRKKNKEERESEREVAYFLTPQERDSN